LELSQTHWVQLIHMLSALIWLASSVVLGIVGLSIQVGGKTRALPRFGRVLLNVSRGLIAPAVALVVGSGVWLVLASSEWTFSQAWVIVGLLLFVIASLGAIQVTRVAMRMRQAATSPAMVTARLQHQLAPWPGDPGRDPGGRVLGYGVQARFLTRWSNDAEEAER
jgi:uncharacterized membrane protein